MSRYRFIASSYPLPEIDLSGFIRLKVKDIKAMDLQPKGPIPWEEMDDEADVLYAEKESDLGGLQIGRCENPPYDLDIYIQLPYIYWLEGNFDERWTNQFLEYAKAKIPADQSVELWSIWFGDGVQRIAHKHLERGQINSRDLQKWSNGNVCIHLK